VSRFPLNEYDEHRVQKAREELAADPDLADDRAMARKIGRLEVVLQQLLEMLDEPGEQQQTPQGGTVTLATVDHGDVTVPEPAWCAGHDDHQPDSYRVDLDHKGPEHHLRHGGEVLWAVLFAQSLYADSEGRAPGLYVEQAGYARTLDPAGVYVLAASMDAHADRLRDLADQLTAILAGGAQ